MENVGLIVKITLKSLLVVLCTIGLIGLLRM